MSISVLLIDSDEHAAQHLGAELRNQGFAPVERTSGGLAVKTLLATMKPDVVVFGYHFDRPDELLACELVKLASPAARVLALATVGPAARFLRQWARDNGGIAAIVERPLSEGQLVAAVRELAQAALQERQLVQRNDRLAALLPEGALGSVESDDAEGELFEAVVLFTDMRRSTELITRHAPREFFGLLNRNLSEQTRIVRLHHGEVVKYTGDGMMAVFRGMGRSHLAVRAALALMEPALHQTAAFGVGLAAGLVLAGLVGDSQATGQRRQYEVIGATAHLAARLCSQADAGEVVLTRALLDASRLALPAEARGPLAVRGFAEPVDCVALLYGGSDQDDETSLRSGPALAGAGPGPDVPVRVPGPGVPRHLRAA
jgi:class 3 adenylate cyclase